MSSKDICELGSFLQGEQSSINGLIKEIEIVDNDIDKQQTELLREIDNYNTLVCSNEESDREIESLGCAVDVSDASISQISSNTSECEGTFHNLEARVGKYLEQKTSIMKDIAVIKEELEAIVARVNENKTMESTITAEEIDYSDNKLPVLSKEVECLIAEVKEQKSMLEEAKVEQTNLISTMEILTKGVIPEKKIELETLEKDIQLKNDEMHIMEATNKENIYDKQETLSSKHVELKNMEDQLAHLFQEKKEHDHTILNQYKAKLFQLNSELNKDKQDSDNHKSIIMKEDGSVSNTCAKASPTSYATALTTNPLIIEVNGLLDASLQDCIQQINPLKYKLMQYTDRIHAMMHNILEYESTNTEKKRTIDLMKEDLKAKEVKIQEFDEKLNNVTAVHNTMQKQQRDIQASNTELKQRNESLKEVISIADTDAAKNHANKTSNDPLMLLLSKLGDSQLKKEQLIKSITAIHSALAKDGRSTHTKNDSNATAATAMETEKTCETLSEGIIASIQATNKELNARITQIQDELAKSITDQVALSTYIQSSKRRIIEILNACGYEYPIACNGDDGNSNKQSILLSMIPSAIDDAIESNNTKLNDIYLETHDLIIENTAMGLELDELCAQNNQAQMEYNVNRSEQIQQIINKRVVTKREDLLLHYQSTIQALELDLTAADNRFKNQFQEAENVFKQTKQSLIIQLESIIRTKNMKSVIGEASDEVWKHAVENSNAPDVSIHKYIDEFNFAPDNSLNNKSSQQFEQKSQQVKQKRSTSREESKPKNRALEPKKQPLVDISNKPRMAGVHKHCDSKGASQLKTGLISKANMTNKSIYNGSSNATTPLNTSALKHKTSSIQKPSSIASRPSRPSCSQGLGLRATENAPSNSNSISNGNHHAWDMNELDNACLGSNKHNPKLKLKPTSKPTPSFKASQTAEVKFPLIAKDSRDVARRRKLNTSLKAW